MSKSKQQEMLEVLTRMSVVAAEICKTASMTAMPAKKMSKIC